MKGRRGKRAIEDPRRKEIRLQYNSFIVPLQFYLLIKCAYLVMNPRDVADEAYITLSTKHRGPCTYDALRQLADEIVQERVDGGVDSRSDHSSLKQLFDSYFRGKYHVVRELVCALDDLEDEDRKIQEARLLDLLANENIAAVIGEAVLANSGQERKDLARLTEESSDLDELKSFFADLWRGSSDDSTGQ
ncbi:hypothetical protein ACIP79_41675 [Streptomyces sp. NPDC088747]|uniref:hypothetical protein n=1 Tax=Streptomyces sp. NPDC088747 TaxID=3365886 RepID=UPI003824D14A